MFEGKRSLPLMSSGTRPYGSCLRPGACADADVFRAGPQTRDSCLSAPCRAAGRSAETPSGRCRGDRGPGRTVQGCQKDAASGGPKECIEKIN